MVNFEEGAPIPRHRSSSMRYLTKKALSHFPTDSNKPSYELFANSIAFLSCQEFQRSHRSFSNTVHNVNRSEAWITLQCESSVFDNEFSRPPAWNSKPLVMKWGQPLNYYYGWILKLKFVTLNDFLKFYRRLRDNGCNRATIVSQPYGYPRRAAFPTAWPICVWGTWPVDQVYDQSENPLANVIQTSYSRFELLFSTTECLLYSMINRPEESRTDCVPT